MTQGSSFHAPTLLAIAARCGLPTVVHLARRPGMQGVFRVTISYHDRRARDTVTTMTRAAVGVALEVVFEGAIGRPLHYTCTSDRYEDFMRAIIGLNFDRLKDAADLPAPGKGDVWLMERGASSFSHGLLLAPDRAEGVHMRLVNAVRNGLPEALRQIQ